MSENPRSPKILSTSGARAAEFALTAMYARSATNSRLFSIQSKWKLTNAIAAIARSVNIRQRPRWYQRRRKDVEVMTAF